jgi:glutathione synthase/RimK-type ligase-like ATP-grasp enzyme
MLLLAAVLNLALLTSDKIPNKDKPDDQILIRALQEYEIQTQPIDWRSKDVVWSDFDAALVYSTWDYYEDYPQFLKIIKEMEEQGLEVYNSSSIIHWNSNKKYLEDLEALGLKPIESVYLSSSELHKLPEILTLKGWDECVIKPQVSTSGHHTYRFNRSNLQELVHGLINSYDQFIIQPFAEEIIKEGEWSFVFFNNEYIHCILKQPKKDDFIVSKKTKIQPPDWMIQEAKKILATINLPALKVRVDVIRRGNELRIMEIEMIEPNLYLKHYPGSENQLAKIISERLNLLSNKSPSEQKQ